MNSNIFNSIILSNEQVNYLMGGTAGVNRLSCLYQLIQMETRQIETSNEVGESTTELWEVNISEMLYPNYGSVTEKPSPRCLTT